MFALKTFILQCELLAILLVYLIPITYPIIGILLSTYYLWKIDYEAMKEETMKGARTEKYRCTKLYYGYSEENDLR